MYYLQSRYYDPAIGRFINADCFATTDTIGFLSYNMFAYCENDPVNSIDSNGHMLGAAAASLAGASLLLLAAVCAVGLADPNVQRGLHDAGAKIYKATTDAIDTVRQKISEINSKHSQEYFVYTLHDPDTKEIQYAGMTNNLERRLKEHKNSSWTGELQFHSAIGGLTYSQARQIEQSLIVEYNLLNCKNRRNSIGSGNPNGPCYWQAFLDFTYNEVTNEYYMAKEFIHLYN